METKQITLTNYELEDIMYSLLMTWFDTDSDKYPALYSSLKETHDKLYEIRRKWNEERKEGAK